MDTNILNSLPLVTFVKLETNYTYWQMTIYEHFKK